MRIRSILQKQKMENVQFFQVNKKREKNMFAGRLEPGTSRLNGARHNVSFHLWKGATFNVSKNEKCTYFSSEKCGRKNMFTRWLEPGTSRWNGAKSQYSTNMFPSTREWDLRWNYRKMNMFQVKGSEKKHMFKRRLEPRTLEINGRKIMFPSTCGRDLRWKFSRNDGLMYKHVLHTVLSPPENHSFLNYHHICLGSIFFTWTLGNSWFVFFSVTAQTGIDYTGMVPMPWHTRRCYETNQFSPGGLVCQNWGPKNLCLLAENRHVPRTHGKNS